MGPLYRLRPNHGVQFIDFELETAGLAATQDCFLEDIVKDHHGERRVLLPLDRETISDGMAWHPLTFLPLGPEQTLWLTGYDAIEPFIGTWTPLPYLRLVGRGTETFLRFDAGPLNWARVMIAPPEGPLREASRLRAVLAIDTRLAEESRVSAARYLAPTQEDATFGSTFLLATHADSLVPFISETWIADWLKEAFLAYRSSVGSGRSSGASPPRPPRFQLEHVARYLTLVKTLAGNAPVPRLRFFDSFNRNLAVERQARELVLDLSGEQASAAIMERRPADLSGGLGSSRGLELRDLNQPWRVHRGPVPVRIEFDRTPFGNALLSRRSGRSDAFLWPSLVRIGEEAMRLSLRDNATHGVTGYANLIRHMADTGAASGVWRMSTEHGHHEDQGPMVAGTALEYLTDDGRVIDAASDEAAALRPRFSRSSLISLFIGEMLLHAVAQVAGPIRQRADGAEQIPAELQRITLALPVSFSEEEQRIVLARAREAVELVWRCRGWDREDLADTPVRPQVHVSVGGDLGAQLVYLHDEVETRFCGDYQAFAAATARSPAAGGVPLLQIASLEVERHATTLVLAEYEAAGDGRISPCLSRSQRFMLSRRGLKRALIEKHILPAIERDLARHGLPSADSFLREITGRAPAIWQMDDRNFAARFEHKILVPAAEALLALYAETMPGAARGVEMISLAGLVRHGDGRMEPLGRLFDVAAARAGAADFSLSGMQIPFNLREIRGSLMSEIEAGLAEVAAGLDADSCDLLLLTGELTALQDVQDAILARVPLGRHRVVHLTSHTNALLERLPSDVSGDRFRLVGVVASYLATRGLLGSKDFRVSLEDLRSRPARQLAGGGPGDRPVEAISSPVEGAVAGLRSVGEDRG